MVEIFHVARGKLCQTIYFFFLQHLESERNINECDKYIMAFCVASYYVVYLSNCPEAAIIPRLCCHVLWYG